MNQWHTLDIDEIKKTLKNQKKSKKKNVLKDTEVNSWYVLLLRQFENPLIIILILAAIVSSFVGDKIDAAAIFAIIILNAVLGFAQEWKAETALKNLKKMLAPHCRIIRDGVEQDIESSQLIVGDRVLLSAGNAVPADLRVNLNISLKVDESALTGESEAVDKNVAVLPEDTPITDRTNMAWMGTNVVSGRGEGIVVNIGMDTEFGRIADLTGNIKETKTHLQRQLIRLAKQIGILALVVSSAVAVIGILQGKDATEMLMTGISLAVAAVPEGLPAVVTITLAMGAGMMARKKALLRNLQAAETLGSVSVICTDKTGTITKNEMTVQKIWVDNKHFDIDGVGYSPEGKFLRDGNEFDPYKSNALMMLLDTARICNNSRVVHDEYDKWFAVGSPTEAALIVAAKKAGLSDKVRPNIIAEKPFDSVRKYMSVIEEFQSEKVMHIKGATEVVLSLSSHILINGQEQKLTDAMRDEVKKQYLDYASKGLRVLGFAGKPVSYDEEDDDEENVVFFGIAGVIDPPRVEVAGAIAKAQKAGIKVILITGDSPDTAVAIAKQVGLNVTKSLTSVDVNSMTDDELSAALKEDVLFARTVPEDKFRIVKMLQSQGLLTAMTGDGVNDAPALKQADIGVAMGLRGTDVAKGAADIVLTDDNFASIVDAVEEGRRQFANISKFVRFLLAHNIGELVAIFTNILLGGPLILIPVQILWVNLVTDGVTALALSVEDVEPSAMSEPPRSLDHTILDKASMILLGAFGLYIGLITVVIYNVFLGASYELANTLAVTSLVVSAQVLVFGFRNLHENLCLCEWFSNKWLCLASFSMLSLHAIAVYTPAMQRMLHLVPLEWYYWVMVIVLMLPAFVAFEIYKKVKET